MPTPTLLNKATLVRFMKVFMVIFLIIGSIVVYRHFEIKSEVDKYDITAVTAQNGNIRLAQYWLYAKYDPLFAIPGNNLDEMEKNLHFLELMLEDVAKQYPETEQRLIRNTLYPMDFLFNLNELERARQTFINDPKNETAVTYHTQLLLTIDSYHQALKDTTAVFNTLDKHLNVGFLAGTTSVAVITKRLKGLQPAVSKSIDLEKARFSCLQLSLSACTGLFLENQNESKVSQMALSPNDVITAEILANKDSLDATYTESTASSSLTILNESLCYPQGQPAVYAFWEEVHRLLPDRRFVRATPANDIHLQDLASLEVSPLYKLLLENGVEYNVQPMNLYFCIDGGVEYQKLSTIKRIYEIAEGLKTDKWPREITQSVDPSLNKKNSSEVLDEAMIINLIKGIDELFSTYTEAELITILGKDDYQKLADIKLLWRTQSAGLDELINTINYMTATSLFVLGIIDIPLEPLYISRSYLSLTFLLGNETINSGPKSFLSQISPQPLEALGLVSANEAFPTPADKIRLKEVMLENYVKHSNISIPRKSTN